MKKLFWQLKKHGYNGNVRNEKQNNNNDKKIDNSSEIKSMKIRLLISICFLIPLMYVAMHSMIYELFNIPVPKILNKMFYGTENALSFVLTQFLLLIPIIYVNRNYFIVGFKRILKRSPNMDSLIAIGSSAATIYGIFAMYMIGYGLGHNNIQLVNKYTTNLYFESAGTILTLITVGKYLETRAKGKTGDAISKLINLAPKTTIVLKNEKEIEIEVEKVLLGDIIIIKPGDSIPLDGEIIEGNSFVDEAAITGESIPVQKNIGDQVISGTINKNGYFKFRVTKIGENTTLAQIIKLVEEASNSKAPISRLADKVSGIFVPVVILIAILATIFWIVQGQNFEFALNMGISVLVISCPCALGLATPVAIMVGTGKGAEKGILIKSAESLETLHLVDTVVLDKTGTITEGKPKVTDIVHTIEKEEFLKIAGSLEKKSEHPLANAVIEFVKNNEIDLLELSDFKAIPGRGVQGKYNNIEILGGNINFMLENNVDITPFEKQVNELLKKGNTVLYFAQNNIVIGIIAVADVIKSTSKDAIKELQKRKIDVIMLTGDNKIVAEAIGKSLGIHKIISEVLPQDKEKEISNLQSNGRKVAFVGDGINDSPALVRANVGLAIGSGTDIAIDAADIILIKNNLLDVVNAISLSKAVIKNIKMNLFWAFFYNSIGIPIAAGIFFLSLGWKLSPMLGATAMSLSSVCVVTNALRLRKFKGIEKDYEKNKLTENCNINCKVENNKKESIKMKIINIDGMACNHCKMSVEKALNSIEGITNVEVSLENKNAKIECSEEISNDKIKEVIEEAGFTVIEIN